MHSANYTPYRDTTARTIARGEAQNLFSARRDATVSKQQVSRDRIRREFFDKRVR